MELDGRIVKDTYAPGTKSFMPEALFLETAQGPPLLLRPPNNDPFNKDPNLEALVGQRVRCSGFVSRGTFFVSHYTVLSQTEP